MKIGGKKIKASVGNATNGAWRCCLTKSSNCGFYGVFQPLKMDRRTSESTVGLALSILQEHMAPGKGAESRKPAGMGWGTQGTEMFCWMTEMDTIVF